MHPLNLQFLSLPMVCLTFQMHIFLKEFQIYSKDITVTQKVNQKEQFQPLSKKNFMHFFKILQRRVAGICHKLMDSFFVFVVLSFLVITILLHIHELLTTLLLLFSNSKY